MDTVQKTLTDREAQYGSFMEHATISQSLQDIIRERPGWHKMAPDQRQAMAMILDKIARICNGDPNYPDSWHDIAGYAALVTRRLEDEHAAIPLASSVLPKLLHKSAEPSKQTSETGQ